MFATCHIPTLEPHSCGTWCCTVPYAANGQLDGEDNEEEEEEEELHAGTTFSSVLDHWSAIKAFNICR